MAYVCQQCGKTHEGLPLDIGFEKPGAYFHKVARPRRRRWHFTPEACMYADERFFIRGCLIIKVLDAKDIFAWGLWAEVSQHTFERHIALFNADGRDEPLHTGALSVEREERYAGMDKLLVTVRFNAAARRPTFELMPSNHWLHRFQHNGITMHQVQEVLHRFFPQQF
jgi:hypothetical protein